MRETPKKERWKWNLLCDLQRCVWPICARTHNILSHFADGFPNLFRICESAAGSWDLPLVPMYFPNPDSLCTWSNIVAAMEKRASYTIYCFLFVIQWTMMMLMLCAVATYLSSNNSFIQNRLNFEYFLHWLWISFDICCFFAHFPVFSVSSFDCFYWICYFSCFQHTILVFFFKFFNNQLSILKM